VGLTFAISLPVLILMTGGGVDIHRARHHPAENLEIEPEAPVRSAGFP
jgi:hypothetical protein